MAQRRRVYVETYGCSLNVADTALMCSVLAREGYEVVSDPRDADVVIINTCTVRLDSEMKMRKRIRKLRELCLERGCILVVAGCMAKAQPYTIKKMAPEAILVSPQSVHLVHEAIKWRRDMLSKPSTPKTELIPDPKFMVRGRVAEIALADGCRRDCSFCITKFARRDIDSRPPKLVVEAARLAVEHGALELRLTAQDLAVYGIDLAGRCLLADVVWDIVEKVDGEFMIRLGMMSPDAAMEVLDDIVEVLKHPKVYKFLHIPVQSGDDRVLKIMNRGYTVEDFKSLVREIRSKIPEVTIATDIIVGHPGEDDEAFSNTLRLVEELRFERVHVAQFTPRPRTLSAALPQVPDPVKKARSKKLMSLVERIGLEEHRRLVGARARVLILGRGERGGYEARTSNYVQVILSEAPAEGGWGVAEITDATWYDVRGRLVHFEG